MAAHSAPPPRARASAPVARGWVRRLAPLMVRRRSDLIVALGAAAVGTGAAVLGPLGLRAVVDAAVEDRPGGISSGVALLTALAVVRFAAATTRRWYAGRVSFDAEHRLRDALFVQFQRLGPAGSRRFGLGQLVSRAGADVRAIQMLFAFFPLVLGNAILLVLSLAAMALLSFPLTLVALLILPLLVFLSARLRHRAFPAAWDAQERAAEVASVVEEAVSGVRVVKAFTAEGRELQRLERAAARLFASRMRLVRIQARYTSVIQILPSLGLAVMLPASGRLVLDGRLSLGTFLAFNAYLLQLAAPARMLSALAAVGQSARAGAERILEVLDAQPPVEEDPDAKPLPPGAGGIVFDDVYFAHEPHQPVLRGFTLTVEPGERLALVGPSGSGKSTAALLLTRSYDPDGGRVLLDGADLRHLRLAELRAAVAVVFQEPFLFSASVLDNVSYARPEASLDEVRQAVWAAGATELIDALPGRYEASIGERGVSLSGGQRQRLTLARALLAQPRVVILDDATSSVDPILEEEIHARLRRHLRGSTTLVVAHRRSTLALVDRVAFIDEGRVVAVGRHEDLLANCAPYRRLLGEDGGALVDPESAVANRPQERALRRDGGAEPGTVGPWSALLLAGSERPQGDRSKGRQSLADRVAALPAALEQPPAPESVRWSFGLRSLVREHRGAALVAVGLVALDAAASIAGPALVRAGVDRGALERSWPPLVLAGGAYVGLVLAHWAVLRAQAIRTGVLAERVLYGVRVRVFDHLQRLGLDFYEREPAGRVMSRMTGDVDSLAQLFQTGLASLAVNVALAGGVAIVLLATHARLALVGLAPLVPLAAMTMQFRRRSRAAHLEVRERVAAVSAALQEGVSGAHVAQAFSREARTVARFRDIADAHLAARLGANRISSRFFPAVEAAGALAAAAVAGYGAVLIRGGLLSPGGLIAFVLYLNLLFGPLQQLSQAFDVAQQAGAATTKLRGVLSVDPLPPDEGIAPAPIGKGSLRLEGVWFAYPGTTAPALAGVDLEMEAGETLALVGASGAGKSTIVKLLARAYDPDAGRVLLDGVDIREVELSQYRRLLGVVPQEAYLMSGTVADNIAYGASDAVGSPEALRSQVHEAARAVGAHESVVRLQYGYDTEVGAGGGGLAAGERQLVSLARARFVDPRILLLDEATSNLDLGSETAVREAMAATAAGRTTIVVAHRLSTAAAADRVAFIEAGRIVEEGPHEELLRRGGRYRAMWEAWSSGKPSSIPPTASPMSA